jgi:hypothetical protein
MKRQGTVALGMVALMACWALTSSTLAQTTPPSNPSGLEAVVRELRLLREVLLRQGNTTARVQLLVGRLAQQDQRTARARQAVERIESQRVASKRERDELQSALLERSRLREQATDQRQTESIDAELRAIRPRLTDLQRELSETELRLTEATRILEMEVGRNDELERLLNDVDRQFHGGQ